MDSSLSMGSISKRLERMARVEDLALNDDLLLRILASYLDDTADVLRCAATCRRWRRLIIREAGFIMCRRKPSRAVGLFQQLHDNSSPPRLQFSPPRHFSRCASLDAVLHGDLLRNSRLMATRNSRLLLELRCGPRDAAAAAASRTLRLAVCNAMTSRVFVLPTLPDMPEHYACALLAAADLDGAAIHPLLRPGSAAYRVVVIYMRGGAMACRSCSSDTNNASWGPEGQVSHANIRSRQLGEMDAGVAVGGSVFWLSGNKVVFGLRLDTLQGRVESPKWYRMHRFGFGHMYPDRRLVAMPNGRLGAVQVGRGDAGRFVMNILSRNDGKIRSRCWGKLVNRWVWEEARDVDLEALLPSSVVVSGAVQSMRLRSVCETSGLVILAVAAMHGGQQDLALYALDPEKKEVQLLPIRPDGSCCFRRSSCSFHGCDMDLAAYLTPSPRCATPQWINACGFLVTPYTS